MDESLVRRWVREFNKGRETVCDRKRWCRPSLVTVERENVFATLSQTIDASNEPDYHLSCKTWKVFAFMTLHKKRRFRGLRRAMVVWTVTAEVYDEGIQKLKNNGIYTKVANKENFSRCVRIVVAWKLASHFGWCSWNVEFSNEPCVRSDASVNITNKIGGSTGRTVKFYYVSADLIIR